jgi:hypothetical protein
MKNKFFPLLVVSLIVTALLSACQPAGPITVYTQPTPRTLTVNGAGMVTLTPDIAYIYIGVHTEGKTAADAVADNTASTTRLVDALVKFGVDKKDINTSNFSIWPSQQYDPQTGQQISTNYVVDNSVYVKVRKLDKLGELLDTAIQAGANSINSIQFDVADKTKAMSVARAAAVKYAKAQAEELANAAGVKLGDVQTISFYDSTPYPVMDAYAKGFGGGAAMAEATVPIEPGQLTLTVTVTMAYEIE